MDLLSATKAWFQIIKKLYKGIFDHFLEIIEDQGILTVYGLMEHRFLDKLDDLGLD